MASQGGVTPHENRVIIQSAVPGFAKSVRDLDRSITDAYLFLFQSIYIKWCWLHSYRFYCFKTQSRKVIMTGDRLQPASPFGKPSVRALRSDWRVGT